MNNRYTESRIISSPDKIKELFDIFFAEKTVSCIYSGRESKVKCHSFFNGKAIIGIPFVTIIREPVVICSSIGNKTVQLTMEKRGKAGSDYTSFDIIKCLLTVSARNSKRFQVSHDKDQRKVVYITDFITDTIVGNSLSFENKRINAVFAQAESELIKYFSSVKFITKNEAPHDVRMQYISARRKGIIIRKIDDRYPEDKEGYDFYMKNIFNMEKSAKTRKLAFSEAVIPLYYRNKFPYGYLRVNNDSNLSDSDLKLAGKFVRSIEQYLLKHEIFPVVSDKIIVHEVSSAGLSVLQSEKKNSRYFKIGSEFCYDLVIPDNKKVHLLARIKHNSPGGTGIIRTGFEIEKIDDGHLEDFRAYIGSFEN